MALIPTSRKEKLPKGFSYPLGAEAISAELAGTPQFSLATITFEWRDVFWASKYAEIIRSRGKLTIFRAELNLWGEWRIYACAVPSEHNQNAREKLREALHSLADQLGRTPINPDHFRWEFAYDLACANGAVS